VRPQLTRILSLYHHDDAALELSIRSISIIRMEFKELVDTAEKWCSGNPFDLIFAEDVDERRLDFYAEPGISFYVLCPDNLTGGTDNFVSMT